MKFEINSIKLFKIINQVSKARNKSTLNSYLNNIYIKSENNSLTMRATNLELTCEKTIPMKGVVNGECLINGDVLTKISNYFSNIDTNITCELVDDVFNILYLKNKVQLKTTKLEDFPKMPNSGNYLTNINLKTYINLIKSVSFCASTSEIKPEISSVYLYSKNEELFSVATDSFRLAEKKIVFNNSEDINILISQKNINEKVSILESLQEENEEEESEIEIYNSENILTIQNNNTTLSIRSINGNFPDYKQLFPKEWTTKIKVDKQELRNTLNLSTIFVNNYSYVDFDINTEEKVIKTKSKNDKIGALDKDIVPNEMTGENILASYNSNYFLDGISHIVSDEVELLFTQGNRPMFIKDAKDESFTYLLMPLNK
ncbi:Beta sliding clamp [bioreactor metagenome]|uniref:Beta sliding clamp n=1 Tax=bioreactor metagenome TaxID=1076179 RepID=A0A644UAH7_9ZZZZ|nr:DNA polymerase III subunit beta [Candidatus Elulimicrobiales bacterium]